MKQQDWIDFFQAVNGRNPSIQEMADAAKRGEFVRESSKRQEQPVEANRPEETVEIKKTLAPVKTAKTEETVETTTPKETTESVKPIVESYDVAEEPLTNSTVNEEGTFQATNLAQENQSKTFQEQVKPVVETASQTIHQFANQTGETFQQAGKNLNETWKKQDKKTQTNLIMLAVASIPAILWALGMILLGIASDDLSAGLITALLSVIINFPLVVLLILPALLNKTDEKWLVFVLSILLNWTFIGWVILLVVSINMNKEAERIKQQQMMMQMAGQQGSSDTFNPFQ